MSSALAARLASRSDVEVEVEGNAVQQGLGVIAAYIPSESLAIFLGVYGIVTQFQPTEALRNAIVVLGLLLIPFFIALGCNFRLAGKMQKFVLWRLCGVISFLVGVLAMPGGPWSGKLDVLGTDLELSALGGALVIILAGTMPGIAKALKLRR